MADTADNPSPAIPNTETLTPTPPKKPRGRPAGTKTDKQPENPQQRIDRLKAELQKAEADKAAFEKERNSIVGRVVVDQAFQNADYRRQLAALLRDRVTGKGELAAISELLS